MSKGQQRHIKKWYAIQTLKYGLELQFKMSERKEGQKTYERNKETLCEKVQS